MYMKQAVLEELQDIRAIGPDYDQPRLWETVLKRVVECPLLAISRLLIESLK